jgi:hypothetical protein
MSEKVIRFQGREYLLVGDLERGGPIATRQQYESFECSYAQLKRDGSVWRFGDTIGHRDEIEIVGEVETEVKAGLEKVFDTILSGGWSR